MTKLELYTGTLKYKDRDYFFVFDEKELRVILPEREKNDNAMAILKKQLMKFSAGKGDDSIMEEPYLVGKCNETGQTMIFLTKVGKIISSYNEVLVIDTIGYILCKMDRHPICRMSFTCPELDCIHPVSRGYNCTFDYDSFYTDGVLAVQTEKFDVTTTEKKKFQVDGKAVSVRFSISRSFSQKIGQSPLSLCSVMSFFFEPTEDYSFIVRLWFIAKEFLQFMCYRKNVFLSIADLSTPADEGKTYTFATFNMLGEDGDEEPETLKKGRYIKLSYLSGQEGHILNDIASKLLYTRHIPDTYISGCSKNAARFVMITAAFEWEFKRLYPEGINKSEKTLEVEANAAETIQKLIDESTGDLKKKYKYMKKHISDDSLQDEVIYVGKTLGEVIEPFGKMLYSLNDAELFYSEMGERLSKQRNNFAHGNLDMDFIDDSLLDLVYLERIIYAMQLKRYGIEDKPVQHAMNELFRCGIAIR